MMRTLLLAVAFALGACHEAEPEAPVAPEAEAEPAATTPLLGAHVAVSAEERAAMGLEFAPLAAAVLAPEVLVYGRVLADPAAGTTLRAPFAGELMAGAVELGLGQRLDAGAVAFELVPRWLPQEHADLAARRAETQAALDTLAAELPTLRTTCERARALNAQDKSVSDGELQQAAASLASAEARQHGAAELLRVLAAAGSASEAALPLRAPAAGEVVELFARAGERVEAGAELVRLQDFAAALVALDLPLAGGIAEAPRTARIELPGSAGALVAAEFAGRAPQAGSAGLAGALLFRIAGAAAAELRPAQVVRGWLPTGAAPRVGVLVPSAAVVRLAGQGFVYLRAGEELERRALALEHPLPGGWFADADWTGGALELVVRGAQNVLSLELLGRQGAEEGD